MKTVFKPILSCAVALSAVTFVNAATDITTVGVYDGSATPTNTVDRNAGSSDVSSFTTDVLAAFSAGNGGVINFESSIGGNKSGNINAEFAGAAKTLAIGVDDLVSDLYNFQTSSNLSPISGANSFFASNSGTTKITFDFGSITGGAVNEAVTQVGFTVIGRQTGVATTVSATAILSDDSSISLAGVGFTSDATFAAQDTFYSFAASSGLSISSVTIDFAGTGDQRRGIDDLGFITAVIPEPNTYAMLAGLTGLAYVMLRRR